VRVPADLAYWNAQYAAANERFLTAKIEAERTRSSLWLEHRAKLEDAGKKPTEKMVDAAVESDDRNYDARVALMRAEVEKGRLNGILDAVRTKRDMIVSIGAHQRAEMQGDPSLRALARNERTRRGEDG
jgi:hypothetical protein